MNVAVASDTNLLPPLTGAEYEALKADIAKRGVIVPIEVDADTGDVLDGHHRQRICSELGLAPPPQNKRSFPNQDARDEHAIKLNLLRRQMDDEAWSDAFVKLAEIRNVQLGGGGDHKSNGQSGRLKTFDLAAELGVSDRTARRKRKNAVAIKKLRADGHADLAEKVKAREIDIRRAERMARSAEADRRRAEPVVAYEPSGDDIRLLHGDFRDVMRAEDLSGGIIITDPPYPREFLPEWRAFAEAALGWECETLIAMSGQAYLPEVIANILGDGDGWQYRWCGAYLTPGVATRIWNADVGTRWKPILMFDRGRDRQFLATDVWTSTGPDKAHHGWGQSESGIASLVEAFTEPGDLVIDPFLGGGTTALVCRDLGRRFIGCDIDAAAVSTARERLAA